MTIVTRTSGATWVMMLLTLAASAEGQPAMLTNARVQVERVKELLGDTNQPLAKPTSNTEIDLVEKMAADRQSYRRSLLEQASGDDLTA